MGRTGAYHRLSRRRPQGRLISFSVLSSVLGQTFIAGCYQVNLLPDPACLPACLPTCLPVFLPVFLPVCLPACLPAPA
eukprot:767474-Hanusia_phi.AAC.3